MVPGLAVVAGAPGPGRVAELVGQGGGGAISRAWAVVITSAQGQVRSILSSRQRAVRTIRPATAGIRSHRRFGS